jgi:hypothetical protein
MEISVSLGEDKLAQSREALMPFTWPMISCDKISSRPNIPTAHLFFFSRLILLCHRERIE